MPIKNYRPNDAGRREASVLDRRGFSDKEPEKSLIIFRKQRAGRNAQGKITVRHRGGGARRFIRMVDFLQDRFDEPAKVMAIEYDPGRGALIALIEFSDKERRYIIAPADLKDGDTVTSSLGTIEVKPGNRMRLEHIPIGMQIHSIELHPGRGGKMARGAGLGAQLLAIDGPYAHVKLPSGEMRTVPKECCASIGVVGNEEHRLVRYGKAGRTRHRGFRPSVRGKAMNPVDHPHGGGEGKHPIGMPHPKTPWGKPALGVKTRNPDKWSSKFIMKRRSK